MSRQAVVAGEFGQLTDTASAFAAENPLLVAAGGVLLLALLVFAVRAGTPRLRRHPSSKFCKQLARYDEVTVLMHPNPDPDAMACAAAVEFLAESVGTRATLQYPGKIRHQENRAFETVLDLELVHIDTAGDLASENVVLVDHNVPRGFNGASGIVPFAVIDHHPGTGTGTAFTDCRTAYGACSTILAEYLDEQGYEPDREDADVEKPVPRTLATGLLYGIQADTKHLTKGCSAAEFRACSFLFPGVDEDSLDRIANPQVGANVLKIKARAITECDLDHPPFAVSDVGNVDIVDAIPQAADELVRLEGFTAVVVLGSSNGTIHISGRSRDDRVHMGKTLQEVVNDIPMSSAGGHARMGGGQVSVEHMEGIGPRKGMNREELIDRLYDGMAGEL
ncbi:bifunctional oligoribonuclease/PAP phosphatase NrnA [Haladaptatus sp. YSMS36]|uniref:DHH family phosphoesterase n=1 Tax=Haladaptatus sp. YSMS36 TaxID=3033384 RepID=UPI0023E8E23F|nr:DHHA1 domain-containing protein [Haladaptatus sp. YSMS36]